MYIVTVKSRLTLTAGICDLSKWVVACVALATNNAGPALALARLWVAGPREGTHRVAVTWETGVGAPWVVVKLLQTRAQKPHQQPIFNTEYTPAYEGGKRRCLHILKLLQLHGNTLYVYYILKIM